MLRVLELKLLYSLDLSINAEFFFCIKINIIVIRLLLDQVVGFIIENQAYDL